jgi:hypothetical protein
MFRLGRADRQKRPGHDQDEKCHPQTFHLNPS